MKTDKIMNDKMLKALLLMVFNIESNVVCDLYEEDDPLEAPGLWVTSNPYISTKDSLDKAYVGYDNNSMYVDGVHKKVAEFLDVCGYYAEFGSENTLFIYPKSLPSLEVLLSKIGV